MIQTSRDPCTPWGHTPCVPCGSWRGATPPLALRFRPASGAAGGEVLQPPNPVAGATGERSPVVADDPADVILYGPPAVTGQGFRICL